MENGLVSTIIPVYNRPALLREAVASVLAQTYRPIEIIIVDDGSTDTTPQVASQLSIDHPGEVTLVRQPHGGVASARNAGLRQVNGEFVQFLDSDDLLMPGKFERQVAGLSADRDAGISYCFAREYRLGAASRDVPARRTGQTFHQLFPEILHGRLWPAPAPLFRRSITDAVGLFRDLTIYEDWEYECRAAARGITLHHCREFLADKRDVHELEGRQKGGVPSAKLREYAEVHALIFDYARKAGAGSNDLDRFSAKLFRIARRCAANGLDAEAKRCLELAIEASAHPARIRAYRGVSRVCGWRPVATCVEAVDSGVASGEAMLSRVRAALPSPIKKPIGYAVRRSAGALGYLRGKHTARLFTEHHREAQRMFARDGNPSDRPIGTLHDVGVTLVRPGARDNLIALPDDYPAMVAKLADAVDSAFERTASLRLIRSAPDSSSSQLLPGDDDVVAIQLLTPFDVAGVADLATPIVKELERKVFGSYAVVDKLYIYRSPISSATPRASWVWHYDNHPREVLKVMIYLTDVTEDTGPFEYLRRTKGSAPLRGAPIVPLHRHGRLDAAGIENWLRNGHECCAVTGPAGTTILFDDNVVHRGTLARDAHRDVVVLQVRPITFRAEPCIDPRWTGSFQHLDINRDPRDVTPYAKP